MVEDEHGGLRFFVHPDLEKRVPTEDLAYIESLLKDFRERAKSQAEALFQQLLSLSVGPLTVAEAGLKINEFPNLLKQMKKFQPI